MSYIKGGGKHTEKDWSERLDIPLKFLIGRKQNQQASVGKIDKYENFNSKYVTDRNVEVWLPENYSKNKKYAVLYMHDGQMLFDSATTWNKQAWDVDDTAQRLMNEKKVRDFIVVGIWNGGQTRHIDYFPQKPYESLTESQKEYVQDKLNETGRIKGDFMPNSDNYLKFLVQELKPFIDKKYSVKIDKENTFIMGSSMGGLISMYAITQYPEVFGGAGCLSTHWTGIFDVENNPIPNAFYTYLDENIDKINNSKIYFDYGNKTLDELYPPLQKEVDEIMQKHNFTSKNWITKFFKGDDHSENSWKNRLHIPLEFLLK
ncbi:MAG: esterase [Flavobacteriales bacterium]|nr:esterase [Flavobacteriales bacterium]